MQVAGYPLGILAPAQSWQTLFKKKKIYIYIYIYKNKIAKYTRV